MPQTPDFTEIEQWTRESLTAKMIRGLSWIPLKLVCQFWLKVKKQGVENVPFESPFIIASNHCSHMDTPILFHALGEKARNLYTAAAVDYFFKSRKYLGGYVHAVFRAVPFDRVGQVTERLGPALDILKQGHSLVFYPEGGRSTSGELQPFKAGLGVLALLSHTSIVPTHIQGTFDSMPKGKWFPKPQKVVVRFGRPVSVKRYLLLLDKKGIGEASRTLTMDVQKAVESLNGKG
jgi:long-chain acyl-CoA synthetase